MSRLFHILTFEWRSLRRSSTLKVLLLVVLGAGIYGIYFAKFEIDKQDSRISQVQQYERQQFDSLIGWAQLDTSLVDNKAKFLQAVTPTGIGWSKHFVYYVTHQAPAAAGLCLGQRDLYPVYYGIDVSDLARQVNVSELTNPMKLLTGNFDLSYVFVFLFPLLVVALYYNLYAGEKEGGTLSLLQSQSTPLLVVILGKGLVRLLVVWGLATVLLGLGFIIHGISYVENSSLFIQWLLIVYAYCLLWILLMGIILLLRLQSSLSAMMGLGVWLILSLITPALLNLFVLAHEPLPNRAEVIHVIREMNDKNWESPKSFVFDKFYLENPEYDDGDTTDFNKWYYASFTLLDREANSLNETFTQQVKNRNAVLSRWEWLAPAAMVHEKLSDLSQTNRESHMEFVQEVRSYHADLKRIYYSRIFSGEMFSEKIYSSSTKIYDTLTYE